MTLVDTHKHAWLGHTGIQPLAHISDVNQQVITKRKALCFDWVDSAVGDRGGRNQGLSLSPKDLVLPLGTLPYKRRASSMMGQEECSGQRVRARVSVSDHGYSRRSEPRKINGH